MSNTTTGPNAQTTRLPTPSERHHATRCVTCHWCQQPNGKQAAVSTENLEASIEKSIALPRVRKLLFQSTATVQ
jgi:hypothetical protein